MLQSLNNLKIGVVDMFFNGQDLGASKGGATFEYAPEFTPMTVDQFGDTPVDFSLKGEKITVTLRLAEVQLTLMANTMPLGTLANSNKMIKIGKLAGERLAQYAKVLKLHPQVLPSNDYSQDIIIYKAISMETIKLDYKIDEQQVYEVKYTGLIDTTKANGQYLAHMGDSI